MIYDLYQFLARCSVMIQGDLLGIGERKTTRWQKKISDKFSHLA